MCVFRCGLAFGGVRVRCLCVRCVLCLVCLPLRVRPRVCPVPVLRFGEMIDSEYVVHFCRQGYGFKLDQFKLHPGE